MPPNTVPVNCTGLAILKPVVLRHVIVFDDTDLEGVNKYLWEIKDQYKLYELYSDPGGSKQVAIINNTTNYNFDTAELFEFKGNNPETYRGYR